MIFFCTGLIFILLLMTMIISNRIIIAAVNAGLIANRSGTPLIPFLIHTGFISIFTGVFLTLILSLFPLKPVSQLIHAIHAVTEGDFHTKISLKHPKEFRELSDCFNQMTDQGIRMDHHTKEKIFEKFYQGDTSHSTEGSGLGLPLTAAIVALHNGTIEVESEPESGSNFTVFFA